MSKILHQVWIQGAAELPAAYAANREAWRAALPDDWELWLWDNKTARARWSDYAEHEAKCKHHAMRADLILARASRDYGGLCTGTDCTPVNPSPLLDFIGSNSTMIVCNPSEPEVSNGLVWSAEPGHPFFQCVCRHQLRSPARLSDTSPHEMTGPGCYWQALKAHRWALIMVTCSIAYTHHWRRRDEINPAGWIDPGYAASWWGK